MNAFTRRGDASVDPFLNPLDAILAEIAINLQLPPGLHAKAVKRYVAVRTYIERDGSPLHDKVAAFYPQGSMAIDATISTRGNRRRVRPRLRRRAAAGRLFALAGAGSAGGGAGLLSGQGDPPDPAASRSSTPTACTST